MVKLTVSLIFFFLMTSCDVENKSHEEYFIKTLLKSIEVSKYYVFCDSTEMENCYLNYSGKRYLKKEKVYFSDKGFIDSIQVFKSEGIVHYSAEELANDTLLTKANNWEIKNQLMLKEDSIISPIKGIVIEMSKAHQKIYSFEKSDKHKWLYLIEY